jgi:hypothetical protein
MPEPPADQPQTTSNQQPATREAFSRAIHEKWRFSAEKHDFSIAQCAVRRYIATARPRGQNLKGDSIHTWQQDR